MSHRAPLPNFQLSLYTSPAHNSGSQVPRDQSTIQTKLRRENSWSFFMNPVSDWEYRRRRALEDYKKEMQLEMKEYYANRMTLKQSGLKEETIHEQRASKQTVSLSLEKYDSFRIPSLVSRERHRRIEDQVFVPRGRREFLSHSSRTEQSNMTPLKPTRPMHAWASTTLRANMDFEEFKAVQERQKEEWIQGLQDQVSQREASQTTERTRKLVEEKKEEDKVRQQQRELDQKHQSEMNREQGLLFTEHSFPPIRKQKKPRLKWGDTPETVLRTRPKKGEALTHQWAFDEIISRVKEESHKEAQERNQILRDFEKMKKEMWGTMLYDRTTQVYKSVSSIKPHHSNLFQPETRFITMK